MLTEVEEKPQKHLTFSFLYFLQMITEHMNTEAEFGVVGLIQSLWTIQSLCVFAL